MAETVAEVKARTLFEKLGDIKAETLGKICCMRHSQKMEAQTICDTQNKEETKALL